MELSKGGSRSYRGSPQRVPFKTKLTKHSTWFVLSVLMLGIAPAGVAAAKEPAPSVVLSGVSHAIENRTLVIAGLVENHGSAPVSRLVVDAMGFAPTGDLAAFGSDGIPWEIRPGSAERFSIALPIRTQLVRDYLVQVSSLDTPLRPLVGVRRGVDVALYRTLLLSLVRVEGDIRIGRLPMRGNSLPIISSRVLRVRSSTEGLPVAQVTVRATILFVDARDQHTEIVALDLDVPADGSTDIPLPFGISEPTLLTLRVVDVRLKTTWSE